jgi:hypothetical protein
MQRRRAQNAADATALAGTQRLADAMCDGSVNDGDIASMIDEYAKRHELSGANTTVLADYLDTNGARISSVGTGTIPVGSQGVSVTVSYDFPTYFVMVVGVETAAASAHATAMTGQTNMEELGGGLRPFGLPHEMLPITNPPDSFTICFAVNCDNEDDCTVTYLDDHSSAHRGWMNFNCIWNQTEADTYPRIGGSCSNVGASDVDDWMVNGWWGGGVRTDQPWEIDGGPGPRIGDYVHAATGVEQSSIWAGEEILGMPIPIPIYDVFLDYEEIPSPKADGASQGGNTYYHIVGVTQVKITSVDQKDVGHHCIQGQIDWILYSRGHFNADQIGYGETGACASGALLVVLVD